MRTALRIMAAAVVFAFTAPSSAAEVQYDTALDQRIEQFLRDHAGTWRDMNVPEVDGRTLRDLIVKNSYRSALEIGTSTGHSAIWIAWGLSKTGGKLITVEVDQARHREAVANFKEAGVAEYIDARLADAHELVPQLEGPFDFVFSDADKDWYKNYFVAVWPKLQAGGCFTAHNITMRSRGIDEFMTHVRSVADAHTRVDNGSRSGLSITCKQAR